MSIIIDENTIGIWFVPLDEKCDWMAALTRTKDGIKLDYRFRYYDADSKNAFDGKDKKNWYSTEPNQLAEKEAIEKVRIVANLFAATSTLKEPCDEILMKDGNVEAFVEEFKNKPWAHAKEMEPNQ